MKKIVTPNSKCNTGEVSGDGKFKAKSFDLTVDQTTYRSVTELAAAFNHRRELIANRIKQRGWSAARAVITPERPKVSFRRELFDSNLALWEAHGKVPFTTFAMRVRKGYPLETCLTAKRLPPRSKHIECKGEIFPTFAALAARHKLTPGQLAARKRMLPTMPLEAVVSWQPPGNGQYSETIFARNPQLANSTGTLYFVRIDFEGQILHKCGISRKCAGTRLQAVRHEVIAEWQGNLALLYRIEQATLKENRNKMHRAPEFFDGKSETFLLTTTEEEAMLIGIAEKMKIYGFPLAKLDC